MSEYNDFPDFLKNTVTLPVYKKWLVRKANAHFKRDKNRGNLIATASSYRHAIHEAVVRSKGFDEYTGRSLRWDLISQYDNAESSRNGRGYKRVFYNLPTVDHVDDGLGLPSFKICSWQVNDAKHDQTFDEFLDICRAVIALHESNAI